MLTFNPRYFLLALLLFVMEVLIALYVHDAFIRPYVGDFLVVILLYCFVKTFLKLSVLTVASGVLIFSFIIETLQYFHFVYLLGLDKNELARVVLGSSFSLVDLLAYTLGIAVVIVVEKSIAKKKSFEQQS